LFSQSHLFEAGLVTAYQQAWYHVGTEPGFTLRIGVHSPQLLAPHARLGASTSAFVTAYNPLGRLQSRAENEHAHLRLRTEIQASGLRCVHGAGFDPSGRWQPEPSLLVVGISLDDARELGARYGQNAIVWCGADAIPQLVLLQPAEDPSESVGTDAGGPSPLHVYFYQDPGDFGWIRPTLVFAPGPQGQPRISAARFSAEYCPFESMLQWIEALRRYTPAEGPASGQDRSRRRCLRVGFNQKVRGDGLLLCWEDEGSEGLLLYLRGRLLVRGRGHAGWWRQRITAGDLARIFHGAFRRFVEEGYAAARYERMHTLGDVLRAGRASSESETTQLLALSRLSLTEVCDRIEKLAPHHGDDLIPQRGRLTMDRLQQGTSGALTDHLTGWAAASRRARMRLLRALLAAPLNGSHGSTTRLARLKSCRLDTAAGTSPHLES
jgi:hypothetical protein